jgi:hypothetical protein
MLKNNNVNVDKQDNKVLNDAVQKKNVMCCIVKKYNKKSSRLDEVE